MLQFLFPIVKTHFDILWNLFVPELTESRLYCHLQNSHTLSETPRWLKADATKDKTTRCVIFPGTFTVAPRQTSKQSSSMFHWRPNKDDAVCSASRFLIVFFVLSASMRDSITAVMLLSHLVKMDPPFQNGCSNCWYDSIASSSVATVFTKYHTCKTFDGSWR